MTFDKEMRRERERGRGIFSIYPEEIAARAPFARAPLSRRLIALDFLKLHVPSRVRVSKIQA